MVTDFIFSADGFSLLQQYKDKFNCSVRIDEPSGESLILDAGNKSFRIDGGTVEDFEATIIQSLETGENLLLEKSKGNEIKYGDDILY